jgi:hypothetical protein
MIYWITQTIETSFQPYADVAGARAARSMGEVAKGWIGSHKTPAAFAMFPMDITSPPREWAERFFNVERWRKMPRGGHFAALEEPELLAEDIRAGHIAADRPEIPTLLLVMKEPMQRRRRRDRHSGSYGDWTNAAALLDAAP